MNAKLITLNLIDAKMDELSRKLVATRIGSGRWERLEKEYKELQHARHAVSNLKF